MKSSKIIITAIFIIYLGIKANAQYIIIDDTRNPQNLIEKVLVNSSCATVSNPQITGDEHSPGQKSFAYFNAGTSDFPFKEGVVLSTWTSNNSIGPLKKDDRGGGSSSWLGDSDLDQILGITSVNATVLEFDFRPLTNFISFNYIFASNEYQKAYPCEYSDGFAFLIKEKDSGEPYKNLAVLPNSNLPVSSMTVRPKIDPIPNNIGGMDPGCPAANEIYFNGFNIVGSGATNYAGQTIVMKSETNVVAGKLYHIKLIVADDRNLYYDSAIFLEAGSFTSKLDLGEDRESTTNNPLCYGDELVLDTKLYSPVGSNYIYEWYKDGTKDNAATEPTYTVKETGTYKVNVIMAPSACSASDEIKIEYSQEITATNTTLFQCEIDPATTPTFNLTKADLKIKNNNPDLSIIYYKSLADAQAKLNPISNPKNYTKNSPTEIIHARVENKNGCAKYAELQLKISNNTIPPQNPIEVCDEDKDGLYEFNLKTEVTPQLTNGLPPGLLVNYYLNQNDAITESNPLPNNFKNTTAFNQTIYAQIINGPDCYAVTPIELAINVFNPPNFDAETIFLCKDATIDLSVATGFESYNWSTGSTSNTISVNSVGNYSITVSDINGCEKTKKFNVVASDLAIITGTKIKDFAANENSILVEYTGIGNYEFSLDGINYQDNPLFKGISAGIYKAYARDKNGCGTTISSDFYVLDYPRFFTPNGDGYNDTWRIKNLDDMPDYTISIFDRYGKLIKQMNSTSTGWDGNYTGHELPSDDYWFTLIFENGKEVKGHFSLKR
ncbi:T9SS type B sorting domain-containing protein [Flavobacterium sp. ALJ2]|uniref:T9SS type B sorting domain-containing protein n=1 Tax=Flavobacterium sp. ALJ2 TaxID=2786960 RepID=UPI00189F334B|nr:choice-of-anchor L domain-containing protein [Flavobacterium sp. ALJ2]MBF7090945.1 T9SS type B sorting domain-containing protein [Flavobacterium sp. ALJ2]